MITPVILCGGSGTRLWPASRKEFPKQFVRLTGARSSFQDTILRVAGLTDARPPLIVAGVVHVPHARAQLAEIGVAAEMLIEPEGRDSCPAIAAAAAFLQRRDRDAALLVLASDHHIADGAAFLRAVDFARPAMETGRIVAFGIAPTHPATGYGYIASGDTLAGLPGIRSIARFVEKPDEAQARRHVDAGLLWNSGNLAFRADVFLKELGRFEPAMLEAATRAVESGSHDGDAFRLDAAPFHAAPRKPVDTAIMERTGRAVVVEAAMGWSDIGTWDAVWAVMDHDRSGNVLSDNVVAIDTHRTLVRSDGIQVTAIGVEDLVIVATADAVLVCRRDASQKVREAVERLGEGKRPETADPPADQS